MSILKKITSVFSFIIVTAIFIGCSEKKYNLKFIGPNDMIVYETEVKSGTTVEKYIGEIDKKDIETKEGIYIFKGYNDINALNETINSDKVVLLDYEFKKYCTVVFIDEDENILLTLKILEGEDAIYNAKIPEKEDYVCSAYTEKFTFSNWSEETTNVKEDMTVYPVYTSNKVYNQTQPSQPSTSTPSSDDFYKIISHLSENNKLSSENEFLVSTGQLTEFGYVDGKFVCKANYDGTNDFARLSQSYSFGSKRGTGIFSYFINNQCVFSISFSTVVTDDSVTSYTINSVLTNELTGSESLQEAALTLFIGFCYGSYDEAINYLDSYGLPHFN